MLLAIWHGGGNWGDGWDFVHNRRLTSLKQLLLESNATIVSLPQSIYYETESKQNEDAAEINRWIDKSLTSSKLVLSFRQENQFKKAKSLYAGADVRLVPDIAFMIGPLLAPKTIWTQDERIDSPMYDILFLLRTDKESAIHGVTLEGAFKEAEERAPGLKEKLSNLKYKVVDWEDYRDVYPFKNIKEMDSTFKVEGGKNLLSLGKVIVTDRLHSSILALLMHKPHIIIEQTYGKISNTRNTAFLGSPHCTKANLKFQEVSTLTDGIYAAITYL